jgi:hypothetical protein
MVSKRISSYWTYAEKAEKPLTSVLSTPLILIWPLLRRLFDMSLPERWFNRVVLPAPEAPIILMNCPGRADPLMPFKIFFTSPTPYEHAIVTPHAGLEYYVPILSFVDKDQLEPVCSLLLNHRSHAVVGLMNDECQYHAKTVISWS